MRRSCRRSGRVGALVFGARAGIAAAALAAFYPDLVWFGAHFWSEIVFLTILWWAIERLLVAHETGRRSQVVVAGLLWGLGILTRETILYLTPLVGIWLAWAGRREGGPLRGGLFVATAVLVVAPWTVRNAVVFDGALVPVSTASGLNLWQGNAGLTRQRVYDLYAQGARTRGAVRPRSPQGPGGHLGAPTHVALREDPRRDAALLGRRTAWLSSTSSEAPTVRSGPS